MSITILRICSKCGRPTPHTVSDVEMPERQPVPVHGSVDLTGGFYKGPGAAPSPEGRVKNIMPQTRSYRCTICGKNTVNIGGDPQELGGSDDFSLLARGADWKDPGR